MTKYNGMFESVLRLQDAYNTPTPKIYKPKKEKWVLVPKFPPVTPTHNTTNVSFEENEKTLEELAHCFDDLLLHTSKTEQIEQQQEQSGPVLTKKLTPLKNVGNK